LEFLARRESFTYQVFLITLSNFERLLSRYRTLKKEVVKALEQLETEMEGKKEKSIQEKEAEIKRIVEEAPISKMVAVIIKHAVDGGASDIHIEPVRDKIRVRFRLDGVLHSSLFLPLKVLPAIVARIKILSDLKIDETRIPQDGRFTIRIEGRDVDFRVSTFPTALGEKVAIRILDSAKRETKLDKLGLWGYNLKKLENNLKKPYGMILITGPTGSGKTTTLYAILAILNKEEFNIMTLEDPVEYLIEGINQSQVKPEIGYTFANGLRHILRQDPDIVMVGEIRDQETAGLAVHAALTGHIVLSTLHTSNTLGIIPRLIDMGIKPFLIPPSLNLGIAQRLVRRLCNYCKKKIKAEGEARKIILGEINNLPVQVKKEIKEKDSFYIYKAVGCKRCNMTGYSGRIGIFEILEMTEQLAKIISGKPTDFQLQEEARRQGVISMRQDGILKVLKGVTSLEEVIKVTE